jgi:hypothetical protein
MTSTRHLAVFGCGHDGRLGLGSSDANVTVPSVSFYFEDNRRTTGTIVSIHVGGYHTLVRTTEGVYGFGANDEGQLGTGEKSQNYKTPTRIDFFGDGSGVIAIECGSLHTVAIMRNGLYACGSNTFGQLGLGDVDSRPNFTKIESPFFASVEESGLSYDAVVSHVSCGTYHTLVALKKTLIPAELIAQSSSLDALASLTSSSDSRVQELIFYPCIVLACGKGDYGELGYDATSWDEMASREQRLKNVIKSRAHDMSQGAAQDDTLAAAQSSAIYDGVPMKKPYQFKKPAKVRRTEFYHTQLKCCVFPLLDEHARKWADLNTDDDHKGNNQTLRIAGLRASHLHSSVVVEFDSPDLVTPVTETYHFGCYYCGAIEGNESSIPRTLNEILLLSAAKFDPVATASAPLHVHGGDEVLFVSSASRNRGYLQEAEEDLPLKSVFVLGKGNIGTKDDDAFEANLVCVPVPSSSSAPVGSKQSGSISISGRSHFLIWKHANEFVDEVFSFGDSVFGQCGAPAPDGGDHILAPVLILKTGDMIPIASRVAQRKRGEGADQPTAVAPLDGVTIGRVVDVQCGAKHSVVLFEAAAATTGSDENAVTVLS